MEQGTEEKEQGLLPLLSPAGRWPSTGRARRSGSPGAERATCACVCAGHGVGPDGGGSGDAQVAARRLGVYDDMGPQELLVEWSAPKHDEEKLLEWSCL